MADKQPNFSCVCIFVELKKKKLPKNISLFSVKTVMLCGRVK